MEVFRAEKSKFATFHINLVHRGYFTWITVAPPEEVTHRAPLIKAPRTLHHQRRCRLSNVSDRTANAYNMNEMSSTVPLNLTNPLSLPQIHLIISTGEPARLSARVLSC